MKKVCGEGYKNVLRDNERLSYMEQFMFRVPKKTKMQEESETASMKNRLGQRGLRNAANDKLEKSINNSMRRGMSGRTTEVGGMSERSH